MMAGDDAIHKHRDTGDRLALQPDRSSGQLHRADVELNRQTGGPLAEDRCAYSRIGKAK